MSRVAKNPVQLPTGVDVVIEGQKVTIKGSKGSLEMLVHNSVAVNQDNASITFAARDNAKGSNALAGTTRALINNMVKGVSQGFERKLQLVGVGYKAKATGTLLNLSLGFSHPVDYDVPAGVTVETPTQTEIVLKSASKQLLGQVASEIRAFRPPEPYKGKGVKYSDETVLRKEAKKK